MAKVLLGVTGSISAYRAADLARDLMRLGHDVRVCLTRSASKLVTPHLFESLTGQPCLVDVFDEPAPGKIAHIEWARWADVVLVAPATAHFINSAASGLAEDMLTTLLIATEAPLVIAPAMNPIMWENEVTQGSLKKLLDRGVEAVWPQTGEVACGEYGTGKLALNMDILEAAEAALSTSKLLEGRTVLITSGPTREPIDDVRYMTNRSSGQMGSALARAAQRMGARVIVVAGPQTAPLPARIEAVRVETALEMLESSIKLAHQADLIIGAAAVADFRPASKAQGKIRRGEGGMSLELVQNPDVMAELVKAAPKALTVAFAAEPDEGMEAAKAKAERKGVKAIAVNDISRQDIGFDSPNNELTLLWTAGEEESSGLMSKYQCAVWLLSRLAPCIGSV